MDTNSANSIIPGDTTPLHVDFSSEPDTTVVFPVDTRCLFEVLTPDQIYYNGWSKQIFVGDLFKLTVDGVDPIIKRLRTLQNGAIADPDISSDYRHQFYINQGRRKLSDKEIRKLENGNIAIGTAYEVTKEEAHALGMELLDLSFDYSAVPDDYDVSPEETHDMISATRQEILGKRIDYFPENSQAEIRLLFAALQVMLSRDSEVVSQKEGTADQDGYPVRKYFPDFTDEQIARLGRLLAIDVIYVGAFDQSNIVQSLPLLDPCEDDKDHMSVSLMHGSVAHSKDFFLREFKAGSLAYKMMQSMGLIPCLCDECQAKQEEAQAAEEAID